MQETQIKLPKPIFIEIAYNYSLGFRKGIKAKIDMIASKKKCSSGIMLRVINIYKKPAWFDSGYFKC